ncbi:MAG: T9SS type A sorting domain-containing protein, partial [Crocinitomicaceae bacterium]
QYSNDGICELPLFEDWSTGGGANPCACKWIDPILGVTLCSYGNCASAEFNECINDCINGSPAPAGWINGGGNQGVVICAIVLPVGLTYFEGNAIGRNINLDWETSSEENNARFEIWYSEDGENFRYLEELTGAGTTTNSTKYKFIHQNPVVGVHYYQLRQFDTDGRYSLSSVIAVNNEYSGFNSNFSDLIPNPTTENFKVFYRGAQSTDEVEIVVYNIDGSIEMSRTFSNYSKFQPLEMDVSKLKPALYQVCIIQGDIVEFKRLLVAN